MITIKIGPIDTSSKNDEEKVVEQGQGKKRKPIVTIIAVLFLLCALMIYLTTACSGIVPNWQSSANPFEASILTSDFEIEVLALPTLIAGNNLREQMFNVN